MGIVYMLIASLLYGIAPSVQKVLLLRGVTPLALVVVCSGFAALFALAACLVRRQSLRISPVQLVQVALVGDWPGGDPGVLNLAYQYLPVGFVTMIHFMFPAIVCFVMAIFFQEKLTVLKAGRWHCPSPGWRCSPAAADGGLAGVLLALASSVTYSFFLIGNERWSIRSLPHMTLTFLCQCVCGVCQCGPVLAHGQRLPQRGTGMGALCPDRGGVLLGHHHDRHGVAKLGRAPAPFLTCWSRLSASWSAPPRTTMPSPAVTAWAAF